MSRPLHKKLTFSEGGNKRELKRGQIIEKIVLGHNRGRFCSQQSGQKSGAPSKDPTKINQINQTGFA